jgi:hypothetical protein
METKEFKILVTCKHSFSGVSISQQVIDFSTQAAADKAYELLAGRKPGNIDHRYVEKLY